MRATASYSFEGLVAMDCPKVLLMNQKSLSGCDNPPASEASREVANLNERKNPHTP